MRYNGGTDDVPLVDNVVDLKFDYFGDPNPPLRTHPQPGKRTASMTRPGTIRTFRR